jgi:hypothetical protein
LFLDSVLVGTALLVAVVAVERARRISRRLKRLTEAYWDLRYELGQLQARVKRLEPELREQAAASPPPEPGTFIPGSSLKR